MVAPSPRPKPDGPLHRLRHSAHVPATPIDTAAVRSDRGRLCGAVRPPPLPPSSRAAGNASRTCRSPARCCTTRVAPPTATCRASCRWAACPLPGGRRSRAVRRCARGGRRSTSCFSRRRRRGASSSSDQSDTGLGLWATVWLLVERDPSACPRAIATRGRRPKRSRGEIARDPSLHHGFSEMGEHDGGSVTQGWRRSPLRGASVCDTVKGLQKARVCSQCTLSH